MTTAYTVEELTPVEKLTGDEIIFRQTYYNQMELCAYRLHEDEDTLPTFSEALAFGSVAHFANAEIVSGESPLKVISNIAGIAETVLDTEYEVPNWRELITEIEWNLFLEEVTAAVRAYAQYLAPLLKGNEPVLVERELFAKIGVSATGRDIVLKGTPDLYMGNILYDYKTSARAWDESKPDFIVQAPLYYALIYAFKFGWPDLGRFLVFNRRKSEIVELDTEPTVTVVNSAIGRAVQRAEMKNAGILPASPSKEQYFKHKRGWYCSPKYCGNWNICPYKFLNDDKDEHEVAVTTWK